MAYRDIAEIIGITAVVISLLFVGYETRLSRSTVETEGFSDIHGHTRDLKEFIAEYPDIWARGCLGEDLSRDESVIFSGIVQSYFNLTFTRWARAQVGLVGGSQDIITMGLALNRYRFPGIDTAWKANQIAQTSPSYSPEQGAYSQAIESQLRLLNESQFEKVIDVAWCGR